MQTDNTAGRVTTRVLSPGIKPLNARELQALYNLFAWVAFEQEAAATETVQAITAKRFGVENVSALERKDYDEVIQFLVEFGLDDTPG